MNDNTREAALLKVARIGDAGLDSSKLQALKTWTAIATRIAVRGMIAAAILGAIGAVDVASAQSPNVYFGNLHSHTSYSDGSETPAKAFKYARDTAKVDFLAITEHNHKKAPSRIATNHALYSGSQKSSLMSAADSYTTAGRFVAFYGQEFSSIGSGNHANVFEINEVIDEGEVPNGEWDKLLNVWLPSHRDSEGEPPILLLNHPSIAKSPAWKEYGRDDFSGEADPFDAWRSKLDTYARLFNILNGPSHGGENVSLAEGEFLRYLNLGLHVAPTGDQDNHQPNWGNAARHRTGIVAAALSKRDLLSAMRNRNVYATEDPNLKMIARINGELMGKRFQGAQVPSAGSPVSVQIEFEDADEPSAVYSVEMYADHIGGTDEADVVRHENFTGDGMHTLANVNYAGGEQYFFLKVLQSNDDHDEEDRVWSAPVWFEPSATPSLPAPSPAPAPTMNVSLEVNLTAEEATISNLGSAVLDLANWKLISVEGNQQFTFPVGTAPLLPGRSVVVTSGPDARNAPPDYVQWTNNNVWKNAGDPGQLMDSSGTIRAEAR
jgi:hypothetical protein